MSKFRKKPVVVDAWLWNETKSLLYSLDQLGLRSPGYEGNIADPELCRNLVIYTLEGPMLVRRGDYIIRGVAGEFYPCKPEIFEATYEAVEP